MKGMRHDGRNDEVARFNEDVDQLLAGHRPASGDGDYQADLALADLLSRATYIPAPRFEGQLKSKLLTQLDTKKENRMTVHSLFRSWLVRGLTAAVVLALMVVAVPSVRVAAQGILSRFVEVESPWELAPAKEARKAPPAPGTQPGDKGTGIPDLESLPDAPALPNDPGSILVSLEEAQAKSSFKIRVPSKLPAGYTLKGVLAAPSLGDAPKLPAGAPALPADAPALPEGALAALPQTATLIFTNAKGEQLTLSQMKLPALATGDAEIAFPAGKESVTDVTVNGQPGQFVEGRWTPNGWVKDGHSQLHWRDAEGFTYDLNSESLGLKELLAVAESIK